MLQFALHHHYQCHHYHHRVECAVTGFQRVLLDGGGWNVMHMSILNALPASMTLAPLNDVNNARESESQPRMAVTLPARAFHMLRAWTRLLIPPNPNPIAIPNLLSIASSYLPHYVTFNALNISDDATRYGC